MKTNQLRPTATQVEVLAEGLYGPGWRADDPGKRPGEKMKDVWREMAQRGLTHLMSATDFTPPIDHFQPVVVLSPDDPRLVEEPLAPLSRRWRFFGHWLLNQRRKWF